MEKQSQREPAFNLDWYRDVIQFAPDTYNIVDKDGIYLFTNSGSETNTSDEFIGKSIFDYFLPEYYENVRNKLKKVAETGENDHYELATDYGGFRRYYMTNLAPIQRDGKVVGIAMYIRDITELKTTQYELNSLNDELEVRVQDRTLALQESAKRMETSEKLSIALRKARSYKEVLSLLGEQFLNSFHANLAGIYEVSGNQLHLSVNLSPEVPAPLRLTAHTDKVFFSILNENQIRVAQIPEQKHEDCKFCEFIHANQMKTLVLAPIWAASAMVGVIYLAFSQAREITSDDEQLMRSFVEAGGNTLHRIQVMEQLEQNIVHRKNELDVLYDIMAIASETVDLDELLKSALSRILQVVNCGMGFIHLVQNDQIIKITQIPDELPPQFFSGIEMINSQARQIENLFLDKTFHFWNVPQTNLNCLSALIRAKGKILGVISLLGECISDQDPEMIHLISSIASEIGLAVESARQRKRAEEMLIGEERQRLARDLHDSVSQSLYGLVLAADISKKLLKLKEFDTLEDTLKDIETFALQSLREMRLMLFELRPLSFESEGLAGALELRLNTVERRAGLLTSLDIIGGELLESPLDLEIYRIATEALNNALKHANASQVHISIQADEELNQCELKVIDNGSGFDLDSNRIGGIGLISMNERAARVGGQVMLESRGDKGTMVRFICPLHKNQGSR
ncbi:MAG: PAS domain-containing protein [Anaerolineaceae bacterium]|jgi:PAS domain S-box-containing protein|nr:PAS domain-containing protein [Anaerolineaceae bacterium]